MPELTKQSIQLTNKKENTYLANILSFELNKHCFGIWLMLDINRKIFHKQEVEKYNNFFVNHKTFQQVYIIFIL